MKIFVFFSVTSLIVAGIYGQTPIPARPLGYTLLSPESGQRPKIVMEIFYDHLCSDSKANWVVLKDVLLGLKDKDVSAIIHIFPLPYHHNAYFTQQVGVVVRQESPNLFVDFIQLIFDNQDMFLSGAVNMTEPQVQVALANLTASKLTSVDKQKIMSGFSDEVVVENARYAWKYAASRSITGTPEFIVNGVIVPEAGGYDKEKWEDFINKLLSSPY